jgi:ECF sigma factor
MNAPGSITRWLDQFHANDANTSNEAAAAIWQRYAPGLLALARRNLDQRLRQRVDEDDVLQSMYKSFCLRQQRGEFDLASRDDLWHILVTITLRKVRNLAKQHGRERRDYHRERSAQPDQAPHEACEQLPADAPTPEEVAVFNEELKRRLQVLSSELRRIALWKLEGYTNEEIAGSDRLNCSLRTVERKLERIRGKWLALAERDRADADEPEPPSTPDVP